MKILAIETSCDETAISIVEAKGDTKSASFRVLGDTLLSQVDIHKEYGGVFPMLAKREHAKNLIPILLQTLKEASLWESGTHEIDTERIDTILEREPELLELFKAHIPTVKKPAIDAIAVTHGPGLEPALWVGINFARALAQVWNLPLIPVNHMEGHIFSGILQEKESGESYDISFNSFPLLALLISGGHTELVLVKKWGEYEIVGSTRDDAVGEAFDKVARLLDLPYPGGPEISRLAEQARQHPNKLENVGMSERFPRPMLNSDNLDFSFSGLKTAVLYYVKDKNLSEEDKQKIAREFEDAVTDVLVGKTQKALEEYGARTLVVGGGVSANKHIREELEKKLAETNSSVFIPKHNLTTDNAVMIAVAGFYNHLAGKTASPETIIANGNLAL